MTSLPLRVLLSAILGVVLASQARGAEWLITGRVVGIADGDTLTLLDSSKQQHKIRLSGIDAPEKGQAFGDRSRQSLSHLAFDQRVEARCHKRDRYGREICKVVRGLTDVNLEQLRGGMAWWYREYAKEQSTEDQREYAEAEDAARRMKQGLWQDTEPVAPWDFRRRGTKAR